MRAFLFAGLACHALAQAPALPPRFEIPAGTPAVSKPAQPSKFVESVGRRAALLGREDGTFEAWTMPVKVLRDFRLSVYFDGALEPVPLADFAERVIASPGRATIVHAHAAFTIRETWLAAIDAPVAAVLLDIDTGRPLRLRASFQPEMKPMWPAGFGGQASGFNEADKALVISEGLRRHAAAIGCPLFSRLSEQVGHQMPDRTVLLEMDITPEIARRHIVPIVIAGSNTGSADARKLYRSTLAGLEGMLAKSDAYYRDFAARTMHVRTPDQVLNDAFEWAKYALEKGWQCNDGVGCGLVAGFGPSGASERPGFAWYFGGDALMNSWSVLDYGDAARVRGILEFLRDRQRDDGKIMHELTQSAALLDWSRYPYGYYHGDTTALYLYSVERYARRTGDVEFLRQSWPSMQKAYRFYLTAVDADGLILNEKAGMAAVETGALSGRIEKDVYLQGAWLAGLGAYVRAAAALDQDAGDALARLEKAHAALLEWFVPKGFLAFGRMTGGSTYDAQSSWQAFALGHGGLTGPQAARAAASLNRPELSTDWGARLFATDSPSYDPLSYNDGSVWPFVNGFVTLAEYRHHRAEAALQHLHAAAALTGLPGAGFIPEYMSGDRAQQLPRAVPHQLFSSSAVLNPLVSGMLGLEGDGLNRTLSFTPHLPAYWNRASFEGYRVGASSVSGVIERSAGSMRVRLKIDGEPLRILLSPAFPAGSEVEAPGCRVERTGTDVHCVTGFDAAREIDVSYKIREGVEWIPELAVIERGDRSKAVRLLETEIAPGRITFQFAGPAGAEFRPRFWHGDWIREGDSETVRFPPNEGFTKVSVRFRNKG